MEQVCGVAQLVLDSVFCGCRTKMSEQVDEMGRDKERQHSCALPIQPPCTASFCIVNEQKLPINSPAINDHIQRQ